MTLHVSCFIHIPSIWIGAREAFHSAVPQRLEVSDSTSWHVSPLQVAKLLSARAASRHKEEASLASLFVYNDQAPLGWLKENQTRHTRLKMHAAWEREAAAEGIPYRLEPSDKRGKGLEVKLALDFVNLRRLPQNDIDIAVLFAMDREIAPAAEQIIRLHGQLNIEVCIAMWATNEWLLPENIRPEIYQQIALSYDDFSQVRDRTNYTRRVRDDIMELGVVDEKPIHQALAVMKSVITDEDGWCRATDLGQVLRDQFPNHPAATGRFIKWFEQVDNEKFFVVDRNNPDLIRIRARQ